MQKGKEGKKEGRKEERVGWKKTKFAKKGIWWSWSKEDLRFEGKKSRPSSLIWKDFPEKILFWAWYKRAITIHTPNIENE